MKLCVRYLLSIVFASATLTLHGCSTPTAAGCGMGVLAGVSLAGLALAGTHASSTEAGPAVLGGALFGIASGCSGAAVAEAFATSKDKRYSTTEPVDTFQPEPYPAGAQSSDPGAVSSTATLNGMRVRFWGQPQHSEHRVELRFDRFGSRPVFSGCSVLRISIDGEENELPLRTAAQRHGVLILETAQASAKLETLKAMQAGRDIELQLCGLRRRLTLPASQALAEFLHRFQLMSPVAHEQQTAVRAAAPGPLPEASRLADSPRPNAAAKSPKLDALPNPDSVPATDTPPSATENTSKK